jgi:hypothetical protein
LYWVGSFWAYRFALFGLIGQHLLGVPVSTIRALGLPFLGLSVSTFWAYRLAGFQQSERTFWQNVETSIRTTPTLQTQTADRSASCRYIPFILTYLN